ncbi:MAG: dihydropteroate synthase [Saprospiraceae bacterium]|nr:dihydropteroate synthase [Saprospiraceae bacterium]
MCIFLQITIYMLPVQETLNCRGKLLSLDSPAIMGIINLTPDSFYDGGSLGSDTELLNRAEKMLSHGAAILDIGGMSSRPGAEIISVDEELRRVLPGIELLVKNFPEAILSIDTVRAEVARKCVEAGARIVNDISAGRFDPEMYQTVSDLGVPYILMHMKGRPKDMQQQPEYEDVVCEVLDFLTAEVGKLRSLGVVDIILDPGFGFGKTVAHNYQLLNKLHLFRIGGLPLLCGISRKSMICKVLGVKPASALNGTTALHMVALQQGANILRVHDVEEAAEVVRLWEQLENE